ncbi:hypothetical protein ACM55G_14595 [Flavobacterium sp. LB3P122]|uniref:hypothetical protein n=1 Tax=Flavobacterium algoriphilum TaxID=3398738 RepID=UPI003A8954A2
MYVDGEKFVSLIATYCKDKGYPEKSYLPMFCKDFDLSYNQWHAYTKGKQVVGTKIIQRLIDIFPKMNLNWFIKDEPNMFIGVEKHSMVEEPLVKYGKVVSNLELMHKLEEMHADIKKQYQN